MLKYCIVAHSYRFLHCPRGNMNWFQMREKVGHTLKISFVDAFWDTFQDSSQDFKVLIVYSTRAIRLIRIRKLICIINSIISFPGPICFRITFSGRMGSPHSSRDACMGGEMHARKVPDRKSNTSDLLSHMTSHS